MPPLPIMAYSVRTDSEVTVAQLGHEVADLSLGQVERGPRLLRSFHWEYRSKECAELRNLARRDIHIINTNLTSRGKEATKTTNFKNQADQDFRGLSGQDC